MSDPAVALIRELAAALARPDVSAEELAAAGRGSIRDDGPPLGLHVTVGDWGELSVTRQWDGDRPAVAELRLHEPIALADLAAVFGASRPLPKLHPGPRTVVFDAAGLPGALLLAIVDGRSVRALRVRAE